MRVVAIIQARMGSTRLPGKVLMDLAGAPMVDRVLSRATAASSIDDVWVATTVLSEDDVLADHVRAIGVPVFRGSGPDVLSRYRQAAETADADIVVRLTADCPLLDPELIDQVVAALTVPTAVDYAANVLDRSYPRGLDVEAFTVAALALMDQLGTSSASREHVTLGPRLEHPRAFKVRSVSASDNDADLRWTVDTAGDLEFVRQVYHELAVATARVSYRDVVRWCRANQGHYHHDTPASTWDPSRGVAALPKEETS